MTKESTPSTAVIIPNWNGKDDLPACLDSLLQQSIAATIIVVENGSTDGSLEFLTKNYPNITTLPQKKNLGFAGGVNVGIQHAMRQGFQYIALLNNDAVVERDWLQQLVNALEKDSKIGIATCKFIHADKKHLDSTGDLYTTWGLPFPRGREEPLSNQYDKDVYVFGASGGASLYRTALFREIGLFDETFFAYYEDVDLSFRAQLAGWKVLYVPQAIAYHQIGATSSRIQGFTTYQTMKNLPMLFWKNVPTRYIPYVLPRLSLAYWSMFIKAIVTGRGWPAIKGQAAFVKNFVHMLRERRKIQSAKAVPDEYIWSILTHDLPPNATNLRKLRSTWHKIIRR